jgi:ribosomal protein S18 acetylase RimI-like enzyme
MQIIEWNKKNNLNVSFFKRIKKIKEYSLICSLKEKTLIEYFNFIINQKGIVLVGINRNKVDGLLIFEKKKNTSINFFNKNLFSIGLKLFFSGLASDKIIFLKFFVNFFFLKKKNIGFNNQIIFLAIDKNKINQGYGKLFINKIKKIILENIYVLVESNNTKAQNFYIKNNFFYYSDIKHGFNKIKIFKFLNKLN